MNHWVMQSGFLLLVGSHPHTVVGLVKVVYDALIRFFGSRNIRDCNRLHRVLGFVSDLAVGVLLILPGFYAMRN
jgi:hypothetical protein